MIFIGMFRSEDISYKRILKFYSSIHVNVFLNIYSQMKLTLLKLYL
jgi:hypothetical protein